jgi:threonine/homoserine/homoserine lactone efflux protein
MQLLPFLAVAAVVVVTPGVDMALVTKNALLHGRRPALATAVGINVGILLWTTAAALGLAAARLPSSSRASCRSSSAPTERAPTCSS